MGRHDAGVRLAKAELLRKYGVRDETFWEIRADEYRQDGDSVRCIAAGQLADDAGKLSG